jgi:hypothetical protein
LCHLACFLLPCPFAIAALEDVVACNMILPLIVLTDGLNRVMVAESLGAAHER